MLYEICLGDAYGASFEFAREEFVQEHNDGRSYRTNPVFGAIGNGRYTDDGQMSLALAEIIVKQWPWQSDVIFEHFFNVFKRDPRHGYSSYLYKVLNSSHTHEEAAGRIRAQSDRSGACMRSCPIGVFGSLDEIKNRCDTQARITHNSDGGVVSSMAVALATHYSLYQMGPIGDLGTWLNANLGIIDWSQPYTRDVGNTGFDASMSAIWIASTSSTLTEVLTRAVALTGDVDTTAAVAMGIASCSPQFVHDLDPELISGFESGAFGAAYLREMDELLMEFARNQGAPI